MIEHLDSVPGTIAEQIKILESSGGTRGNTISGVPVVLMHTVGAKSGQIRKALVVRIEYGGVYLVVGSAGGAPKNPSWVYNLRDNPVLDLRDQDRVFTVRAEEVTDAELRAQWWSRALQAYSDYAEYAARAGREIPIFTLTPTG